MEGQLETDRLADEALADPALSELFAELRAAGKRPAPPVGPELARLLSGASSLAVARSRRRKAARASVIGLATAGIMAGGLGAAAANELPGPAQRIISTVVNKLTPFEIPNPDEQGPVEHQPDTTIEDDGDQPGQNVDSPGMTPGITPGAPTAPGGHDQNGPSNQSGDNNNTDSNTNDATDTGSNGDTGSNNDTGSNPDDTGSNDAHSSNGDSQLQDQGGGSGSNGQHGGSGQSN